MDWSREEVEAIVADYLEMLIFELSGQVYSKTSHRKALLVKLNARSEGAIEFKHGNISAALIELGLPYIGGYKSRPNYQMLVLEVIASQWKSQPVFDKVALAAVQQPAVLPTLVDFTKIKTQAPVLESVVRDAAALHSFRAAKRDYLAREAANMSLGLAGEELIVQYEHWRLVHLGLPKFADLVEHVAKTKGDGLGFDVLSFNADGSERFIEVKTTTFAKETPFFVSRGELALSKSAKDQFHLYRLFAFRTKPHLFEMTGALDQHCILDPVSYRASFG